MRDTWSTLAGIFRVSATASRWSCCTPPLPGHTLRHAGLWADAASRGAGTSADELYALLQPLDVERAHLVGVSTWLLMPHTWLNLEHPSEFNHVVLEFLAAHPIAPR